MCAAELKQAIRKRGGLKHKVTNFTAFLKPIQDALSRKESIPSETIKNLEMRVQNFRLVLQEFEEVQVNLEYLCDDNDLEDHYVERGLFVDSYSAVLASAETILAEYCGLGSGESIDGSVHTSVSTTVSKHDVQGVRLPTIQLPKFNGKCSGWLEFKNTFESLIHDNTSITEIQKFHYLRASLEGNAKQLIQAINFTADNYTIAWELLCNRFNNTKLLIHSNIKALFDLEVITKESSTALRALIDGVFRCLRSLQLLKQPIEHWDGLLIFIISTKLDKNTIREWEKENASNESPTLEDLKTFLQSRANWLEALEATRTGKENEKSIHVNIKTRERAKGVMSLLSANMNCYYCKKPSHSVYKCEEFLKLEIPARLERVRQLNLCQNCLSPGHPSKQCRIGPCKKCKLKHNSLLHKESTEENTAERTPEHNVTLSTRNKESDVLLATVVLLAYDADGKAHKVRAVLDNGSQSNFITERLSKKLNLKQEHVNSRVGGLGAFTSTLSQRCDLRIQSRTNEFSARISCLTIPRITEQLPSQYIDVQSWKIPSNLEMADPNFNEPSEIHMLLGASHYWEFIKQERIQLEKNSPILQNTVFGWIVSGRFGKPIFQRQCFFSRDLSLEDNLRTFWEIEETTHCQQLSPEDLECEKHFMETCSRDPDGRFVVRIPLRYPVSYLGNSKNLATKRLLQLESKLQRDPMLKEQYQQFMDEYKNLGHMSEVKNSNSSSFLCILPHHGVLRKESLTTKLRVVFDGSAPSDSGWSLNEIQHVGPPILNNLFEILIRFREHQVAVCADIEKMYRQILVHPDDRYLQCVLWRENPEEDIAIYALNTVTYGTSSAPYLAIRCMKQLSKEALSDHPAAAQLLERSFYVDDLIASFKSTEQAVAICQEVSTILEQAKFPLRKWTSNSAEVVHSFKKEDDPVSVVSFTKDKRIKTLGIVWNNVTDNLSYQIPELADQTIVTKRTILSGISRIYDPLGLLGPCTVLSKILIQKLWKLQLDWDEEVPDDIKKKWAKFRDELPTLGNLQIQRHVGSNNPTTIEIHGFSDASNAAYAACVYVRSIDDLGTIHVHLLCAKTRVTPLKTITTPRLELCGALMLAKLVDKVTSSFTCDAEVFLWCDSQIVLCWLRASSSNLNLFVGNRISEIQTLTNVCDWRYINTKENPADLASRGVSPETLVSSTLWWKGPTWLSEERSNWPPQPSTLEVLPLPETKKQCLVTTNTEQSSMFDVSSSLIRLKRIMAYCLRFVNNTRTVRENRIVGCLTVEELDAGMKILVRMAQAENFSEEIGLLRRKRELNTKNKLLGLSPFLDKDGLLRVGGRLKNSELSYSAKHPLLLNGKHKLTRLILEDVHRRLQHAGPQLLLSTARLEYWPTAGMCAVKRVTRECITCFRAKPIPQYPIMADLPKERVTETLYPFQTMGVDYAGPFSLRDRKGRGCKLIKGYICLFVCFGSKALHLELVTDLTSDNFLAALRRFVSRRGKPLQIFSDNGTNFVGAKRQLKEFVEFFNKSHEDVVTGCATEGIEWVFIPPNSPHFGGLWESAVKRVKFHLSRVLQDTKLTYEEFTTVLVQIEATLNSKPLCPLSSDPSDLNPLTPSHFLIGRPLTTIPEKNVQHVPINRLSRFQLLQRIQQSFWSRWSKEYLSSLQQRNKWRKTTDTMKVGTMVLIKSDNLPVCQWLLGRVVSVYPDSEGIVRVADVRTLKGVFKRAVAKLCPLPVPESD